MTPEYKKMFELAGIKAPGQTVKVYGGRHDGLKSKIVEINFNEGEVLLTTKKDYDRWFSIAQVTCLDPAHGTATPLPTRAPSLPVSRISESVGSPNPSDPPKPLTEPSTDRPSWMPKRI